MSTIRMSQDTKDLFGIKMNETVSKPDILARGGANVAVTHNRDTWFATVYGENLAETTDVLTAIRELPDDLTEENAPRFSGYYMWVQTFGTRTKQLQIQYVPEKVYDKMAWDFPRG